MIVITNVSSDDTPNTGINQYEVRINHKVICAFEHDRQVNGLAACLRDAADAVEKADRDFKSRLLKMIEDESVWREMCS